MVVYHQYGGFKACIIDDFDGDHDAAKRRIITDDVHHIEASESKISQRFTLEDYFAGKHAIRFFVNRSNSEYYTNGIVTFDQLEKFLSVKSVFDSTDETNEHIQRERSVDPSIELQSNLDIVLKEYLEQGNSFLKI